jgi:thioredoxin-related protein
MSKLKTILSIFIIILFQTSTIFAQEWQFDLNEAQEKAKSENKIIVLVFSGSDWCAPCIKLEKEIWNSEEFKAYAQDKFVMVRADFPRKKENKLTQEQQQKNNQLAEKYNLQGYFPLVIVMDNDLTVLGKTGYKNMTPTEYIEHLNSFIN